jgi:equilibrative nucleoside transporter 1/2/3
MSHSRARSLSIDALYRPVPQGPEIVALDQEQVEEDVENSQLRITPSTGSVVDADIKWVFFILGCSVLLPWNGLYTIYESDLSLAYSFCRS